jgi:hypothetical protein
MAGATAAHVAAANEAAPTPPLTRITPLAGWGVSARLAGAANAAEVINTPAARAVMAMTLFMANLLPSR